MFPPRLRHLRLNLAIVSFAFFLCNIPSASAGFFSGFDQLFPLFFTEEPLETDLELTEQDAVFQSGMYYEEEFVEDVLDLPLNDADIPLHLGEQETFFEEIEEEHETLQLVSPQHDEVSVPAAPSTDEKPASGNGALQVIPFDVLAPSPTTDESEPDPGIEEEQGEEETDIASVPRFSHI